MPAPGIYSDGGFDPFVDKTPIESLPDFSLLYATLRRPAEGGDRERFYTNDRGKALRAGVARVEVGRKDFTWEEARRVSLAKNRPDRYPLEVTEVRDLGIFESSIFTPNSSLETEREVAERFANLINERLAGSRKRDVYVYVHGYKVAFPSKWAYFADSETAVWSAQGFRRLLSFLAEKTEAERIHILGYSAGTRVVTIALNQIALMNHRQSREGILASHRLGDVALVGSDVDRELMGLYVEDGLLNVQDRLTIYLSGTDKALGISRRVLGGQSRMGERWAGEISDPEKEFLENSEALSIVDVTDAEESDTGNGHAYFRKSPWASSDVLMTLSTDLGPAERGLVKDEDSFIWTFPPDYVERLRMALEGILPEP
jgi:esterase/lipase superfamily enzyme